MERDAVDQHLRDRAGTLSRARVRAPTGVTTSTVRDFDRVALTNLGPPRVRLERAVLSVAARAGREDEAVAVLADACQSRRTTPERLATELGARTRLPGRALLGEVLANGAHSALERRYSREVERAHGLPSGVRQRRVEKPVEHAGGVVFRDVDYPAAVTVRRRLLRRPVGGLTGARRVRRCARAPGRCRP